MSDIFSSLDDELRQELTEYLSGFITQNKLDKIEQVLRWRTRHITVVLEDIYQPQNASAVIRTCDCFGIQDLHIIENRNEFRTKKAVTQGASKWVDLHRWTGGTRDNSRPCLHHLREKGYTLVATTLSDAAITPDELDLGEKTALIFGNEEDGISEVVAGEADVFLKYPMYGFTQSFNISVSAALIVSHLIHRLHATDIPWQLDDNSVRDLRLQWIRRVLGPERKSELLASRYLQERRK